jgi:molecular chaperone HtpG
MKLPKKFRTVLEKDSYLEGVVLQTLSDYSQILEENNLFFFEEYTNHGIKHIQQVLDAAELIISSSTFKILSSKDIAILILAIILHDIGMHTSYATFKKMADGELDKLIIKEIDQKKWSELWKEYLEEIRKLPNAYLIKNFGRIKQLKDSYTIKKDLLDGTDKKIIGEFIRRNHPRIAHEIAVFGLHGESENIIEFASGLQSEYKDMAGLIARSHGMNVRATFDYLHKFSEEDGINLMMLISFS